MAIEANVKRLVLFSHDPMHNDAQVDAKLAHCRQVIADRGSKIEVSAASEQVPLALLPADVA